MDEIIFITGNQAKADYLAKWLGHPVEHQKVDLEEIQSLDPHEVVADKARRAYEVVGHPVLVEDVALSFGAFGGKLPGTLIKWFLEETGTEGMLKMLEGFTDRSATASIMYGLYDGAELYTFEASVAGTVPMEIRGNDEGWKGGKSWNSIFIPDGATKAYAEMTDEELAPFSHRAKAIEKLRTFLDAQPKN